MATKPPFLKYVLEIMVNMLITNESETIRKFKPLVYFILSVIIVALLWIFDPNILESTLKLLLNLF